MHPSKSPVQAAIPAKAHASTETSDPSRGLSPPEPLPREAEWQVAERTWRCGDKDTSGSLHGLQRYFRQDGTLRAEYHYCHGERHGPFRRYHPDGTLAREGAHQAGNPVGQVIAYRSLEASDEPLRRCCVPPGAHKMVIQYGHQCVEWESFLDQQGRQLLPDGSLHPERPPSVDEVARYVPQNEQWESGCNQGTKRDGVWKWWSKSGQLREVAEYAAGQHHGVRQTYTDGQLVASWTYRQGTLHGSGFSRVTPGTYEDSRIVWQQGHFTDGVSSGVWSFLDAQLAPLFEADLGVGLRALPPDDPAFVTPATSPPSKLDPARISLLRLRQLSNDSSTLDPEAPVGCPLPARAGGSPALTRQASQRWIETSRNTRGDVATVLAKLLEGLTRGVAPSLVLREMACYLLQHPTAGLELVNASLALEPEALEAQATRILLLAELGQLQAARQILAQLRPRLGPQANSLQSLLDITFPAFDYLPARFALDPHMAEQLPDCSAPDVKRLRQAIGKAAMRLGLLTQTLHQRLDELGQSPHAAWLPPDVSFLLDPAPHSNASPEWTSTRSELQLESYTYQAEFEGDSPDEPPTVDTVVVDETLKLEGYGIGELMRRARNEWTSLCWLCYSAGLKEVALPVEAQSPEDFGRAITTAFTRHHRLQDQLRTGGVRSRALGALDFEWEGLPISDLGSTLLKQAHDEYLEMRAMLYFAADETCRSPWQDDLRA